MQLTTLAAFIFGIIVLGVAAYTSSDHPLIFLNSHAALIVFGGTLAAAAISFGFHRLYFLVKVFVRRILFGQRTFDPQRLIEQIMILSEVYRTQRMQLPTNVQNIKDPFLHEAMQLVIENFLEPEDMIRILGTRTASIYHRYLEDAMKFKALAKFPPAFGLMGAVMGMIGTMSELGVAGGDSSVGRSLALALVGTLYGVALANLVILPLAENLLDSAREIRTKNSVITEAIQLMMQQKNPALMAEELNSFWLASERIDWKSTTQKAKRAA